MQNVYDILAGVLIPQQLLERPEGFISTLEKEGGEFLNALCGSLTAKLSADEALQNPPGHIGLARSRGRRRCLAVSLPGGEEANFLRLFIFYDKPAAAHACFAVSKTESGPALFLYRDGGFEKLRSLGTLSLGWFFAAARADRGKLSPGALRWKKHMTASGLVWLSACAGFLVSYLILGRLGSNSISSWETVITVCIAVGCAAAVYFAASLIGFFISRDAKGNPNDA